MTACDSDETDIVKFVAQKVENQLQRRPKEKNWEFCAKEE